MNIAGSVQRKQKNAKIETLKWRINNQNEERESADVRYHIHGYENGHYSVYRVAAPYTIKSFHTLVKKFDTDDAQTMGVGLEADCMPFDQYAERLRQQADCGDKQAQSLLTYINSTCQSQQMKPQATKADFRQWFFNQYLTGKWKQK